MMGRGIDCPPAFRNAEARLELMDEQGIDYAIMLPTLASLVEERMRDDPDLAADAIHALNRWMVDEWPFQHEGRIFSVPIITPGLVHRALEELEYVLDNGAKVVLMRPAPAWGLPGAAVVGAARVRPVLGANPRDRHARRRTCLRQRLHPLCQ